MRHSRLCCVLVLTFLGVLGCNQQKSPLTPQEAVSSEPALLPVTAEEDQALYDEAFERLVAQSTGGTVTLNGGVITNANYEDAPFPITQSGKTGDLALFHLRTRAIPYTEANTPSAPISGPTVDYGAAQMKTDVLWRFLPVYLTATEPVTLELDNRQPGSGPLYSQAVTWDYAYDIRPAEDAAEPNDDDDALTLDDRTLGEPFAPGDKPLGSMFETTGASDKEDWYTLTLQGGVHYLLQFKCNNGQWGTWRFDLALFDRDGTPLAGAADIDGKLSTLRYTPPGTGPVEAYLQVVGTPVTQIGSSVNFAEYFLILGADNGPDITAVSPLSGVTDTEIQLTATNEALAAFSWVWSFPQGGVTPTKSFDQSPILTLGKPGDYPGVVVAKNGGGSDTFKFVIHVTVAPPVINSVTPLAGTEGTAAIFGANVTGPVDTWSWDFGGGANPNLSTDPAPAVTLTTPGSYSGSVTATNEGGSDSFDFTLEVEPGVAPVIASVDPATCFSMTQQVFTVSLSEGSAPLTYDWSFDVGTTPDASTDPAPSVRLPPAGVYNGSVTVTNGFGEDTRAFTYTVEDRMVPLKITILTSGATFPTKWFRLSEWTEAAVKDWFDVEMAAIYHDTGFKIDPDLMTVVFLDNPTLFNNDNSSDENALWNIALNGSPDELNVVAINANNRGTWSGVMTDTNCGQGNGGRGCLSASYNTAWMLKVMSHELGHVMNLPHTRTSTNPITSGNHNMMGYGTDTVTLSTTAVREGGQACVLWNGNPHNQFQVMNDWINGSSGMQFP